jgi:hypothetical protein
VTEGTEDWIIDGILSADTTLLYGEPKLGKSYFVSAMLAALATGADTFLGKKITGTYRPALCWTDDRGWREYKKRMSDADEIRAADDLDLSFVRLSVMRSVEQWEDLSRVLSREGRDLVVIDNMTSAVDGSLNDDRTVRAFFAGVKVLTDAGMAVLILAHASDAKDQYGRGGRRPQGHTLTSASVRWRCFMERARGPYNVKLSFSGNVADPHEITVHGDRMTYGVLSTKDAGQLRTEKAERTRNRDKATLDENAKIAQWVVDNGQGKSASALGHELAGAFGGAAGTHTTNLNSRRKYGAMLTRGSGSSWALS